MNRRNAVIGWATWTFFKGFLKRKAKAEAVEEEKRRFARMRRSQPEPEPEPKKRSKKRVVGFLAATAVGVGIWLKARRPGGAKQEGEPVE